MKFSGRVRIPDVDHPGVPAEVIIEGRYMGLTVGDDLVGEWSLADVRGERLVANAFALDLKGEEVTFLADEQIDFAYQGVEHMAHEWARVQSLGLIRRLISRSLARRGLPASRVEELRTLMLAAIAESEPARAPGDTTVSMLETLRDKLEAARRQAEAAPPAGRVSPPAPPIERAIPRPEPVVSEPEPEPVMREPEPVMREPEPEPVMREPEPVVSEPEPQRVMREPEPVIFEPEPEPEPVREPEPEREPVREPEPVARQPEPAPQPVGNGSRVVDLTEIETVSTPTALREPALAAAKASGGLFATVRSAFVRNRAAPHSHLFVEAPGGLGIVRRICQECGYVSIVIED